MYNQRSATPLFSERTLFFLVFGLVTLVLVGGGIGTVVWLNGQLAGFRTPAKTSAVYTNYSPEPADPAKPYLQPASLAAMAKYITEHPQPQNVQVLKGMDTATIANYMVAMVAGGLKVDCTYCHNLSAGNFAAEDGLPVSEAQGVARKTLARQMMLMSQDLNQNFVATLPASVGGKQITCATCHNGKAVNFNGKTGTLTNYPADQSPLPDTFQLKLDTPADIDLLLITGKKDPNLAAVQYNQQVMTHHTQALGVGCAFCHNANYFPSNERPQKTWALTMLKMAQHINTTYKPIMAQKAPSCWMCHQGQQLPPGSANTGQVPAVLGYTPK
ncbi:MAG TPA: photosynthetic reaction center cytochrome c subunit family protein [Kouleothrix sp.]|uniref:photosynthetic reaction center cytochrome c subunit family protein n=1 Tax=Kouleothrix sp. TaxID=2779161 RepID=UPI002C0D020B|nr:photosynthetic reaction center cytochrome c subunit family protein [Kouleothrix sp.]HRC74132.1 photosynthetic reaction center cytochrome c subunit family protein [Kouleothrix sp.]